MRRTASIVTSAIAALVLAACGGGAGPVPVTSVTVTPDTPTIAVGGTLALSAVVSPAGANQNVNWSSSAPEVATVSSAGVVTGVSAGTAEITATSVADPARSGSAVVTVAADPDPDPDPEDPITVDCTAAEPLSENITVATTLPVDCYRVTTNVSVTAPLTLRPGTVLEFTTNAGFRVADGGSFNAVGTAVNPIRLTSASGDPNDWNGLGIFTSSTENVLERVTIENAGRRSTPTNNFNYTNFYVHDNARVEVRNSTFRRAGGDTGVGLYVNDPSSTLAAFEGNTFDGNGAAPMRITTTQLGEIGAGNTFGLNALPGARAIRVAATTVRTDATWRAADVPYRFFGHHFIDDPGATVTIEAGTVLEFESGAGLRVEAGTLRALGTASDGITFTSASGNREDWRGVGIASSSNENALEYVTIENAGERATPINNFTRANLYLHDNARVAVSNSTFAYAGGGGYGILVAAPSTVLLAFDDNEFVDNSGAPILLYANQVGSLGSGNVFGTDAEFAARFLRVEAATVTTTQTWQQNDIPYRFFGNTIVNDPDATVTIEPGATLQFNTGSGLRVSAGAVRAVGTAADRITFTSASGNTDGWRGLGIFSSSASNALRHVDVRNAGQRNTEINAFNFANLYVAPAGVVAVTESAFEDATGWGIYLGAGATVTDQTGTPIDPETEGGNTFSGNTLGEVDP